MKTGDKASIRLGGTIYTRAVKRAFVSPLGVQSVWIEWPKGIDPKPSRTTFHQRDLEPAAGDQPDQPSQEPRTMRQRPATARPGYDSSRSYWNAYRSLRCAVIELDDGPKAAIIMSPRGIVMAVQMWLVDQTTSAFQSLWPVGGFFKCAIDRPNPAPCNPPIFFVRKFLRNFSPMTYSIDLFGDPVPANRGRSGRPQHIATAAKCNKVRMLLPLGRSNERIANGLSIARPALR